MSDDGGKSRADLEGLASELGHARAALRAAALRERALAARLRTLESAYVDDRAALENLRNELAIVRSRLEATERQNEALRSLRSGLIASGGVVLGRHDLERLSLAHAILRAFRERLFTELTSRRGTPGSGIDAIRAPKVMVGTLSSGEHERERCAESVRAQTYGRITYEVFEGLGKAEAVATLMETFQKSDCDILIKVDADMVLAARDFIARVVEVFQANPAIEMLQMAILDFFSGGPMQGINAYRKSFGWRTSRQDRLFTDKTGVPSTKRMVVWSTFVRDVVHSPDPSSFQAFHFGVHRGVKVLQPDVEDYQRSRAEEQLAYLERTWEHLRLRRDRRLALACLGFELALGGRFDVRHLDYSDPSLRRAFEAELADLDTSETIARVEELREKPVTSARVEALRRRRGDLAAEMHRPIETILMLVPHVEVYGGVNRFLELARQLGRLGVRCVVARPEPAYGETTTSRADYSDVDVRFFGDVLGEVWDVVLCGDALSGVLLTAPLFSTRMVAAYLLNGWMHAPANFAQLRAIDPDVVLANSSYAAAQLRGLAPTVVPGGVDLATFHPAPRPRTCRPGQPLRVCVYPGRRKPRKRFDDAVEACRILHRRGVPVELHAYDQESLEVDEPFEFVFHGAVDKDALRALLWEVDVMLCPEEDAGWSNPAAEAMACGAPLVCTEAGTTDFAIDGDTALVVPARSPKSIADALARLNAEPELAASLAERGLEQIRGFGWPHVARALLDALSCGRLDLGARAARNAAALDRVAALGALERA